MWTQLKTEHLHAEVIYLIASPPVRSSPPPTLLNCAHESFLANEESRAAQDEDNSFAVSCL